MFVVHMRMRRDDNVCNYGQKVWLWAKMQRPALAVSLPGAAPGAGQA